MCSVIMAEASNVCNIESGGVAAMAAWRNIEIKRQKNVNGGKTSEK